VIRAKGRRNRTKGNLCFPGKRRIVNSYSKLCREEVNRINPYNPSLEWEAGGDTWPISNFFGKLISNEF